MRKKMNRRNFLKNTISVAAGTYFGLSACNSVSTAARGANEEIRIAVIGLGWRGGEHVEQFRKLSGVTINAVCDPDRHLLDDCLEKLRNSGIKNSSDLKGYADAREILDRKDIDAVVIAAPNHWHALMTVWACQAGKHVYVEKPVSHSIWEGHKMVEAARKYNRIVQAGTQHRSCPAVQQAAKDIQAGKYGKVLWVHCSRLNSREAIGKVTEPQPVPDYIDYNLWAGPAPMTPVMRKKFHYDWHWQWNWGDGDMANWGIHYLDDLRHLLGWDNVPESVIAGGNRFGWDDNGQTPNMHFALMEYDGLKVVVDVRNLPDPKRRGGSAGALYLGRRDGNYIQCENASVRISRGGGGAYDNKDQRIFQYKGDGGAAHAQNFIDALRKNSNKGLNAEIETGHLSTAMCHQANICFRAGREAPVEQIRENIKEHEDALNTFKDMLEQLDGNSVKLDEHPFIFGPALTYDRRLESFTGANSDIANKYVKCSYREPFILPESV
ncbi:MAG: Gfo/Idh/MocA family oxidoreductase [Sedimentisphaerales bacterium]|nr:Gfo/Idh/MocA family oxidoreductase [Sedimentisphaerales bacterium]